MSNICLAAHIYLVNFKWNITSWKSLSRKPIQAAIVRHTVRERSSRYKLRLRLTGSDQLNFHTLMYTNIEKSSFTMHYTIIRVHSAFSLVASCVLLNYCNYATTVINISKSAWKTRFILIWHCKRQRKIRCLERDLNSHLRVSRPPLYQLSYRATGTGSESYPV